MRPQQDLVSLRQVHAVGRAAAEQRQPRLIDLVWGAEDAPRVTLVGKGVCFDSGGISIKGSGGMEDMKGDMAGAYINWDGYTATWNGDASRPVTL